MSTSAMPPIKAFATMTAACAPTEYDSSWLSVAAPPRTTTISACCVPTPPGVTGSSVVSEPTTITSSALRSVPGMPKASRKAAAAPTRQTQPTSCGVATRGRSGAECAGS